METIQFHWIPAKDYAHGRQGYTITSLILHSTDGRVEGDIEQLTKHHGVSVHWYVTRTGEIYHFVDDADTAWHVGKSISPNFSNPSSIGIEQEHFDPGDEPGYHHPDGEDWPEVQIQAVANLVAALFQRHGPLQIKGHKDVAVNAAGKLGRKQDPANYPWEAFYEKRDAALRLSWEFEQLN